MRGTQAERPVDPPPGFDQYWEALAHVERRRCLVSLLDRERRVEMAVAVDGGLETERRRALRETHLPMLAELDLIDWEPGTRRVERGAAYRRVAPLVRFLDEYEGRLPEGAV